MIYQGALLHYLYLVADRSIALAEMVLKYKNCKRSNSYYERECSQSLMTSKNT